MLKLSFYPCRKIKTLEASFEAWKPRGRITSNLVCFRQINMGMAMCNPTYVRSVYLDFGLCWNKTHVAWMLIDGLRNCLDCWSMYLNDYYVFNHHLGSMPIVWLMSVILLIMCYKLLIMPRNYAFSWKCLMVVYRIVSIHLV